MLSIRSKLDRRLEDRERPSLRQARVGAPPLNLLQTPEDVIVRMKLPRVKPEAIENSVTGDALSARGEIKSEQEKDNSRSPLRELRHGSSARSVALPAPVVGDKAQARFQDGVRTLALPKAERVRPNMNTMKAAWLAPPLRQPQGAAAWRARAPQAVHPLPGAYAGRPAGRLAAHPSNR